ncbi:MAG: glutamate--tRNA ligase [Candidatus Micrarchaeia archaeon]
MEEKIMKEVLESIRIYTIKNAYEYGKARYDSVLGKILSKFPESKNEMTWLSKSIKEVVEEVNSMAKEDLESAYAKYKPLFEEEYKKKVDETSKPRMVLEGAEYGNFATRFAPAPNGFMHIGHAKTLNLANEFAKIYNGKIFLYFDDTNPEKDSEKYVDMIKRDCEWLGVKFDGEYYASDNIEFIYEVARKLIKTGNAYVCKCSREKMKEMRLAGKECEHRTQTIEENLKEFEGMLSGKFNEGEAVLRFKGDMQSPNTVMRDPTLMRVKKSRHYRQGTKYIVWPTYDLNTPVNDSIHGITDPIRSKEYELRDELYYKVLDAAGLRKPRMHSDSRLVIKDNITHKREINQLIKEGLLEGYDDPRLVTIAALRNRGILPEAIRDFVLKFGMSKTESKVDISMLMAENKKYIDPTSKRLFFVKEPVKCHINGMDREVKIPLHPTNDLGYRSYKLNQYIYISKEDIEKSNKLKLKDLCYIEIEKNGEAYEARMLESADEKIKAVQWLPEDFLKCKVLVPKNPIKEGKFDKNSLEILEGYAEPYLKEIKENEIIQFERFGFCIMHQKEKNELIFISS